MEQAFGKLPLYFVENQGQLDERVAYYIQGSDKTIYFTPEGVTFALTAPLTPTLSPRERELDSSRPHLGEGPGERVTQRWAVKLDFVNANPDVRPIGQDKTEAIISYLKGPPDQWHAGLPTYASIIYLDLWPGIDLVYYGTVNRLKYEFIVHPGADPARIRLAYRGATDVALNATGQLEVMTPLGAFTDDTPMAYQEKDGQRVTVPMAYQISEVSGQPNVGTTSEASALHASPSTLYGFTVGPYDPTRPLILDPSMLIYCGYIGGNREDRGEGIAVDSAGSAYITGWTWSSEASFPVAVGPDLTYNGGGRDAFVAKVNATGSDLVYAGYIGGNSSDYGNGIAVDGAGNAYVTGDTHSTEASFPVSVGPDKISNGGWDAFVAKVNAAGSGLVYAGYIGGSGGDSSEGIAVDSAGNAYVTGYTGSPQYDFPVAVGPDLTHNGVGDAFVAKITMTETRYSISGRVQDLNGNPFPGAVVSAGAGLATVTDAGGAFTLTSLLAGTYTLTPTLSGYAFWPATRAVTLPPSAADQNFIILPGPVSTQLFPGIAAGLTYTDLQGLPTTLLFPADAVSQVTTMMLTPTIVSARSGLAFTGHAFDLTALQGGVLQTSLTFGAPVTVTIHYSDQDVRVISDENQLRLYWWTGSEWQDAAQTCNPASSYTLDMTRNVLSVPICHASRFAMFGPTHSIYLPLVRRN